MAYKPRPKKTLSRTNCINLAMRVHITLWPVSLNQHAKHQLFSTPAGNRNDIDPSSFLQFSITMLFGANLKCTNKLYRFPYKHISLFVQQNPNIVESKEFTRSEIWNSLLATKSRVACVQHPPLQELSNPPFTVNPFTLILSLRGCSTLNCLTEKSWVSRNLLPITFEQTP